MMYLCESSSSSYPHSSCRPHIYNIQVDRCRSKNRGCWHICTDTETQRNCTHPSLHEARNRINTYQKRTSAPTVFSVQAQPSLPQYVWVKSACFARSQSCSLLFLNCVDLACDKLELVSYSRPALCDPAAKANIFILFNSPLSYDFLLLFTKMHLSFWFFTDSIIHTASKID